MAARSGLACRDRCRGGAGVMPRGFDSAIAIPRPNATTMHCTCVKFGDLHVTSAGTTMAIEMLGSAG
jgi:hypothetical protein